MTKSKRPNKRHIQYFSLLHLFWIVLIFKMGVILSFVVILFLWERGQAKHLMISSYWKKDMLFWERGSVFVLIGKKKRLWTPSRVIWIRYDRGRPSEDLEKFEKNQRRQITWSADSSAWKQPSNWLRHKNVSSQNFS